MEPSIEKNDYLGLVWLTWRMFHTVWTTNILCPKMMHFSWITIHDQYICPKTDSWWQCFLHLLVFCICFHKMQRIYELYSWIKWLCSVWKVSLQSIFSQFCSTPELFSLLFIFTLKLSLPTLITLLLGGYFQQRYIVRYMPKSKWQTDNTVAKKVAQSGQWI